MKMLLSLLLLITVPVVVAQTIVDAPLLEEPGDALTTAAGQDGTESFVVPTTTVPDSVSHDLCCGQQDVQETTGVVTSACSECDTCSCGNCCHVGGCGDEDPCGTGCQGVCCNNVILDENGNIIQSDGAIVDDGGVIPDGSATAIDDGTFATSVRGFGGGSGISAFSGGWGIGFGAVGGGGGGSGRRAAAFAAGVGVTRGFRDRRPLSASD